MPRVTALLESRQGVAVELDGRPWRTLPAQVVAGAGLRLDRELDRRALRDVRRELRRAEALDVASRALGRRDLSRRELADRLGRAGVDAHAGEGAIAVLERARILDDVRAATARAEALAGRGYGDEAIRCDLERRGFDGETTAAALEALPAEADRAVAMINRHGATRVTARRLARRGFRVEVVEALLNAVVADDAGGAVP
jgi:regulatory protein